MDWFCKNKVKGDECCIMMSNVLLAIGASYDYSQEEWSTAMDGLKDNFKHYQEVAQRIDKENNDDQPQAE
ncbi:MAG: hypothetical protein WC089_03715 [Candidatus Paceibacterota bacterium]